MSDRRLYKEVEDMRTEVSQLVCRLENTRTYQRDAEGSLMADIEFTNSRLGATEMRLQEISKRLDMIEHQFANLCEVVGDVKDGAVKIGQRVERLLGMLDYAIAGGVDEKEAA